MWKHALTASLAFAAATSTAHAVGFTVNNGSYVQAVGGGSNTQFLFLGFNWSPGVGSNGAGCQPLTQMFSNGLTIFVNELRTNYFSFGPGAQAALRGKLYFTPTVPNLSYTFNGFMNVVQGGTPASMSATSGVTLVQQAGMFNIIEVQYGSSYTGPCALWQPAAPSWGTQTGNLLMGATYELSWDFTLTMYHGGDTAADFSVKQKNGPYFQFKLYQRPCQGDLNGDGYVDDSDFVVFATAYSILDCADPLMPPGCPSDLNGDGYVDDADFVIFAGMYENLLCP
ncbi:MAG: hypothetical protein K2Y21_09325 [Phycisphaerales bacterium]|nr:hypothetical protein [Phycisphaerales bacterium]